ncbi:hypothetical protein [Roseateles terrae]|uniref:Uncharacterized protein n=1 Tax=Roseateles terrae TaxID=431060 RepID=A0ABR6GPX0_9BURK|nr:hypothetical protein [Roseateles terrae]MBB3193228.1 hypothetical protein [Roseateles terrae]
MNIKYFFTHILHVGRPAKQVAKVKLGTTGMSGANSARSGAQCVDLECLKPTPRMTADDIEARVKKGRVAEMSLHQAGLQ